MQKPEKMNDDKINSVVSTSIEDAVSFVQEAVADDRIKAMRYFNGEVDLPSEEGWSEAIATKCRDVVRAIKPSLMRTFLASERAVEFLPRSADDTEIAQQVTEYADFIFKNKDGYKLLLDVFHDALTQKCGILKVYFEQYTDIEIDEYAGLTADELTAIMVEEGTEAVEYEEREKDGMMLYDVKISRENDRGDICFDIIPPEDFFVNAEAKSLEDAYVCGHSNDDMRVGDVVQMGYDFDEVIKHAGDENDALSSMFDEERTDGYMDDDGTILDPASAFRSSTSSSVLARTTR